MCACVCVYVYISLQIFKGSLGHIQKRLLCFAILDRQFHSYGSIDMTLEVGDEDHLLSIRNSCCGKTLRYQHRYQRCPKLTFVQTSHHSLIPSAPCPLSRCEIVRVQNKMFGNHQRFIGNDPETSFLGRSQRAYK